MATFTELCEDVYTLTKRPDLVAETKLAVKAATLKAHQVDDFYKDIREEGVSFSLADYLQSLEYRSIFPRFRKVKYIRKSDVSGNAGSFLSPITPTSALDAYGSHKADVFYGAGELIQLRSSTEFQYIFFGFYENPDLTEASFNSWVALDHPYAIVYEAAATIYKMIGQDEQASMYKRLCDEQYQFLKQANIEVEG